MALFNISFHSETIGKQMEISVILPQTSESKGIFPTEKLPVLYLLHGMNGDHTNWYRRSSIERYVAGKNLAVVMPDVDLSWYMDMKHGGKYYTYVTKELRRVCHEFFPQLSERREDTFVAGNSMGGYGALKLALLEPEVYSACATLSGALDFVTKYDRRDGLWGQGLVDVLCGTKEEFCGSDNDLFAVAERLAADQSRPKPRIYQWCGTSDHLYGEGIRMRDHLQKLGFDVNYSEGEGNHSWPYWDKEIQNVLAWLNVTSSKKKV